MIAVKRGDPLTVGRAHPAGKRAEVASALSKGLKGAVFAPILVLLVALSTLSWASLARASGYANSRMLVDTEWVAAHSGDEGVRLLDARQLSDYMQSHIPQAVHFDVGELMVERDGVRGMLPEPEALNALFGAHGFSPKTTVVIYDGRGGLLASRLWFALDYMGHEDVRLLNGGWQAWSSAGRPVTRAAPLLEAVAYQGRPDPSKMADAEWLAAHLKDSSVVPVDARTLGEYTGQDVRASRGGHVPGAVHLNWSETLSGTDMRFKSADELEGMFRQAGVTRDKTAVPYCQTHVRGAQVSFVLRLLGYEKVRGYDGSWSEWGNRPDLPVER